MPAAPDYNGFRTETPRRARDRPILSFSPFGFLPPPTVDPLVTAAGLGSTSYIIMISPTFLKSTIRTRFTRNLYHIQVPPPDIISLHVVRTAHCVLPIAYSIIAYSVHRFAAYARCR